MAATPPALNPMLPLVEFIRRNGAAEDGVLATLRGEVAQRDFPAITPEAGKMLHLLTRISGARSVVEVGTGLGYSGIWIARGLPKGGHLRTIEADPEHAATARQWFERAGVADRVHVMQGKALGVLPALPTKSVDLLFIDADKENYPRYFDLATRLVRSGGLICADNVFWFGAALSDADQTPDARGIRAYNHLASTTPGVDTLILPLGDGLSISVRD